MAQGFPPWDSLLSYVSDSPGPFWGHVLLVSGFFDVRHHTQKQYILATKMTFNHPLTINLHRQTQFLLSKIPSESPYATAVTQAPSPAALLEILSQLLYLPAFTLIVAKAFRPLLLDLCARWLQDDENIENKLVALSLLLEPHEELYP